MSDRSHRDALRAWFLGPRAENAELLERLLTEALRDHVFWRRNYHPEDGFTVRELDKRTEGYDQAVATLTQEMMGLLAELKRGVPAFSGRYKDGVSVEDWKRAGSDGLVVLRATVMDPFLGEPRGPDHVSGLVRTIRREAVRAMEDVKDGRSGRGADQHDAPKSRP